MNASPDFLKPNDLVGIVSPAGKIKTDAGNDGGPEHAFVKRAHDVLILTDLNKVSSDDRCDDRKTAKKKRELDPGAL